MQDGEAGRVRVPATGVGAMRRKNSGRTEAGGEREADVNGSIS